MRTRQKPRVGALESLELLVALPILILVTLGTVYFGTLISNLQSVSLTSRVGAHAAAEFDDLPTTNGAPLPDQILSVIQDQMFSVGIRNFQADLEHNLSGGPTVLTSTVGGNPPCAPQPDLATLSRPYVRVTICVQLDELAPDIMRVLGFSIAGPDNVARQETILRYERTR